MDTGTIVAIAALVVTVLLAALGAIGSVLTYFAKKFFDSADENLKQLPGIRSDLSVHSTRLDQHEVRIVRLEDEL